MTRGSPRDLQTRRQSRDRLSGERGLPSACANTKIEQRLITRRGRFYKPKGMLWRTFHRLCNRYDHHNAVLNAGLVQVVERLMRQYA